MKGLRILFQGDSITDGGRGRTEDPNHILGHSYAFSIGSRLAADFPERRLEFFNRGVGGDSHVEMERRWESDTLALRPDVLSVLVGTNGARQAAGIAADWDRATFKGADPIQFPAEFEASLRRMIEAAKAQNPELLPVLCTPFRFPSRNFTAEEQEKIRAVVLERESIVRRLAVEYDAVLADFRAALENAVNRSGTGSFYWSWDGVHVTAAGSEILAREWMRAVSGRLDFLREYRYR